MDFPKVFELIMEAILKGKSVEIEYQKNKFKDSEITKRKITPKKFILVERRTNYFHRLCVKAYCHLRKEERVFAVYRIKNLKS